ncbi:hypothetical protein [Hymenobacter roseosalivarius]|uniref:hypothetical protein n=1 Tax=Hymenobacter roseosalivarius TaxID=89967 RepID=UPI00135672A0|nr:hypothetical protein [Hymenobacter roseosalivarius]
MEENFKKADYVIKVQVVSLADTLHFDLYSNPVRPPFTYGYSPSLLVNKVLKGQMKEGEMIRIIAANSMCSYYFGLGLSYVVFIYVHDKAFTTSVCSKNFLQTDRKSMAIVKSLSRR